MVYAFQMMNKNANNQRYINSHLYQLMKYKYSQIRKQLIQEDSPTKGKIWITNLELEQNRLIYKDQQLSQGWLYGRVINFNNYKKKYEDALNDKQNFHFLHYEQDIKNNRLPIIKKNKYNKTFLENKIKTKKDKRRELARLYFEEYKINGFKGVKSKFNYSCDRSSFRWFLVFHLKQQFEQFQKSKREMKQKLKT